MTVNIGDKFGKLTIEKYVGKNSNNQRLWECRCECGNKKVVRTRDLTSNHTRSCGCLYPKAKDLTGQRFSRLIVVKELPPITDVNNRKYHYWLCKCDCGKYTKATTQNLIGGSVGSCGCLKEETLGKSGYIHGLRNSRFYSILNSMKQRCNNPQHPNYPNYGGRGIKICDEWNQPNSLPIFTEWALSNGYQDGLTIDRIDVNGNYEPSNCRWATRKEQARNTRRNVFVSYKERKYTLSEFSETINIDRRKVSYYLKKGLTPEEIEERFSTNDNNMRRQKSICG